MIAEAYDGVVFDVDGVLVRGHTALPGAASTLDRLRRAGVGFALVTNNASRTPAEVAAWLGGLGVPVAADEVLTSSEAAAALLPPGQRCLVVGTRGLREPLARRGCVLVDDPADADAVVVGLDPELRYDDLRRATLALHRGARFVGTNGDVTFPTEDGLAPGNGAVIALLEAATGRRAEIAGKPHPPLFEAARARLGVTSKRLLMVGDRLGTDIAGAQALGWDAAVVLTGVTDAAAAAAHRPAPTFVLPSVAALVGGD